MSNFSCSIAGWKKPHRFRNRNSATVLCLFYIRKDSLKGHLKVQQLFHGVVNFLVSPHKQYCKRHAFFIWPLLTNMLSKLNSFKRCQFFILAIFPMSTHPLPKWGVTGGMTLMNDRINFYIILMTGNEWKHTVCTIGRCVLKGLSNKIWIA